MKTLQKEKEQKDATEQEKAKFRRYLVHKRERREWTTMQDTLLMTLKDRLKRWHYVGTWEARKELYEILTASQASLKAQYHKSTEGQEPEFGAQKAAEKAVAKMGKASAEEKRQMAKTAADMYMRQDGERKKAMFQIDQAIKILGPFEKTKASEELQKQVEMVEQAVSQSRKNEPQIRFEMESNALLNNFVSQVHPLSATVLYDGRSNPLLLDQEEQPIALEKIQRVPKKEGTTVPMFSSYVPGFTYTNLATEN